MKAAKRILLTLVIVVVAIAAIAYIDGKMLPVDHSTSVSAVINAPPAKVFELISNVSAAPSWRHAVRSVQVLPPESGGDHWIEDLGHGQTMEFLAIRSEMVGANGSGRREVRLNDPKASYGGTWIYELSAGPSPEQTQLGITENGFIQPPVYRFMMVHLFGMTRNLDQYVNDLQAAVKKG